MKKSMLFIICLSFFLVVRMVFSSEALKENYLYFFDSDNNNKIDLLEIEFNTSLSWSLNPSKLFLYSNTGGLSLSKLDGISGNEFFKSSYISGNILWIRLQEQDNLGSGLIINNTTSSHLRLKTNAWVWIYDQYGNEMKLLYTSSFNNYNNVLFKLLEFQNEDENTQTWETQTGSISIPENPDTNSWTTDTQTGTLIGSWSLDEENTQTWETQTGSLLQSFSWKILFQSPTYLESKEIEKDQYHCLSSQTDCKVNYNLNINTGSGFTTISTTKYNCEWDFWLGEFIEEKYKCNPNTITYPEWKFITKYKISEVANPNNFFEQTIEISNSGYIEPPLPTKTIYKTRTIIEENNIFIDTPKIQIQWWLDENNICKKEDCNLNLLYESKNSKEVCQWSFIGWIFDAGSDKKCNPGYVKYPLWDFRVKLKVYEAGNEWNFKESSLYFKNNPIIRQEKILQDTQTWVTYIFSWVIHTWSYHWLQISKILPNPSGTDHAEYIEITNTSSGKINLKGCELDDKRPWASKPLMIEKDMFLDENTSYKFFKFESDISLNNSKWDEVNLICNEENIDRIVWYFDTPDDFIVTHENALLESIVTFTGSIEKIDLKDIIQTQTGELDEKIVEVINKNFTQKIKKQKKWVKIYGKTFPNTKVIIELSPVKETSFFFVQAYANNTFYETISDEKGNYEFLLQQISIGDFEVKNYLKLNENKSLALEKTQELEIESDYIEYMNFSKNTQKENKKISKNEILKSNITLQNLAKGISVSGNKIVCQNMGECSINFDGRQSSGNIQASMWDFWNGKTDAKLNPASIKFWVWKYIISLKLSDGIDESISYFLLDVTPKISKQKTLKEQKIPETKNTLSKNKKIDIIPTVYAKNEEKTNVKMQIFMITFVVLLFLILSFILIKREKLI